MLTSVAEIVRNIIDRKQAIETIREHDQKAARSPEKAEVTQRRAVFSCHILEYATSSPTVPTVVTGTTYRPCACTVIAKNP